MSRSADPIAPSRPKSWVVELASRADLGGVVVAVQELLLELGGTPPDALALQRAAAELIDDPGAGAVIVARSDAEIVGVLAASWQLAIHVPGRYATIQDLWVHRAWRSRSVGAELIDALVDLVGDRDIARIEVGLPSESFSAIAATERFYRDNDFARLGPRMRRIVS